MANALGPPIKPKYKPKLPRLPPVNITAGAAITAGGEGAAGRGGRAGRGGGGWRGGRSKWPNKVYPQNGNTGGFPPKRENMKNRLPLVFFVSQRNDHKILMVLAPARGLVQPANRTLSQLCQTYS